MQLSRNILAKLDAEKIAVPAESLFALPEKVLQFGTGVLLRGLPDHFIDKANKQNIFLAAIVFASIALFRFINIPNFNPTIALVLLCCRRSNH